MTYKAVNFINDQEIWALLDANRNLPHEKIEAIIDKASLAKGLEQWEVADLIQVEDQGLMQRMFTVDRQVK